MWLCPGGQCADSSSFLDFTQPLSLALTTREVNVFTALLHTHLQSPAYCIVCPCSFVVVRVVICLLAAENSSTSNFTLILFALNRKRTPLSTALPPAQLPHCSIPNRKMSYSTFRSEVSSMYFYAYPSSFSATLFFPLQQLLSIFYAFWTVSKQYWKGIAAMYLSIDSNNRGVLCPKSSSCAGRPVCQHHRVLLGHPLFHIPSSNPSGSEVLVCGRIICHLNCFITHIHYCPLLENTARFRCLSLPQGSPISMPLIPLNLHHFQT